MNRAREKAERPAGVPAEGRSSIEQNVGAGIGIVAGAAAGAIAGPIGLIVGATLGSVIGDAAGSMLHEQDVATSRHDHELDDAIGVTKGPIGVHAILDFPQPAKLATFLRADHDELEELAGSVVKAIAGGDREVVAETIAGLQHRVLAHLDGEERDIFPAYAKDAPDDARELLDEHAQIRRALAELDVTVDLHLVRADAVATLLDALRKHAARENAGLYRWAAEDANNA